jgi:hypothetical protein
LTNWFLRDIPRKRKSENSRVSIGDLHGGPGWTSTTDRALIRGFGRSCPTTPASEALLKARNGYSGFGNRRLRPRRENPADPSVFARRVGPVPSQWPYGRLVNRWRKLDLLSPCAGHHSVLCRMLLESLVIDDNGATKAHAREAGASYHPPIDDCRSAHLRRYFMGASPISLLNTRLNELPIRIRRLRPPPRTIYCSSESWPPLCTCATA